MSELPSGFQERDIKEGILALSSTNEDGLDGLIEALPVLSSPVFHAELPRFRSELAGADLGRFQTGSDSALETHRANFMANYDGLFLRLHQRAYLEHIKAARSQEQRPAPPISPPYAPPFFEALGRLLNGRTPPEEGPCYDPASDLGALEAELSGLLGRAVELPAYKATAGSLWGVMLLACANCGHPRLGVRAYFIDLLQAPDLLVPLEEKRIDADLCPQCGAQAVVPKRFWVQERPNPRDSLASLSCLLFANPSELIYLAPPGTIRDAAYDRILEIRAEIHMRQLSWSPPQAIGNSANSGPFSLVIVYSPDELAARLQATTLASPALPASYLDFVANMAQHLASGITPVYRVMEIIRERIPVSGKDWPIVVADVAGPVEEPSTALVQNLVAQACADVQGLSASTRAELTVLGAQSLLILHQTALAEASLARAEDLLNTAPPDETGLDDARRLLAEVRGEILRAQGQPGTELTMPQRSDTQDTPGGDNLQARLMQVLALNNEALGARALGRFSEALPAFFYCINNLRKLEEEVRADAARSDELLRDIRYHLSGAQANLGMTLADIADYLDLSSKLQQSDKHYKLTPKTRALLARAGSAEALRAQLEEIIKNTVPILDSILPAGYTTRTLLELASRYLQTALAISEEVEGYDYACIQAYQLAFVLDDLNQPAEATAMMRQSMKHAAHVKDYPHLASGSFYLAERAMAVGQGQEALEHWKEYVRYLIRELAAGGGAAYSMEQSQSAIADKALNCVAQDGDPVTAILVAESVRGIATALSLLRGAPIQLRADAHAKSDLGATRLSSLLRQRESLRLQVMWNEAQRESLRQQITDVEQELDKARRDLSLQDPRYARWSDATHLEVSNERVIRRILHELGPRTTLVGFLPTAASVWVYALWEDGQIIVKRPLPTELQAALDSEPAQGRTMGGHTPGTGAVERQVGQRPDSRQYLNKRLGAAARVLLEPLTERLVKLRPQDHLILSPCEPLDLLPFGALPFRGRPLCEQAVLSIIQGSGMLEACENRPHIQVRTAVCIGAPTRSDVPDLRGALEEARHVTDLLKAANVQVQLLTEQRATIAALQNLAAGSDLVHFACHAGNKTLDEQWAQLLLAPDPQVPDSGILSEDQILSNLPLKEGCLVNLAGCRTGLLGSEGRYLRGGLVPAFLVAGAGSVIGSLWPLEDWPAASFQSAYYQRLIAGVQPAEALAFTQRECIAGKHGSSLQDVRNWGSYLVYGIG